MKLPNSSVSSSVALPLLLIMMTLTSMIDAYSVTGKTHRAASSSAAATTTYHQPQQPQQILVDRREALLSSVSSAAAAVCAAAGTGLLSNPEDAHAESAALQDALDIDKFLKTGMDTGGNMGVSSQAGKSRPQTGVVLRDGSDVLQDRQGNVVAEILTGTKAQPVAVVTSFTAPQWKLETGPVFDVECRDGRTGDGAFLAVSGDVGGKKISDLSTEFLFERLFRPEARFSFYGPPTDIKVKKSRVDGNYRFVELGFSTLSQSTNAEIPRKALLVATIPEGTNNAVMLVGSANAARWRRDGAEQTIRDTIESFRAVPAPKTSMKLRAKQRGAAPIEF